MNPFETTEVANPNQHRTPEITLSSKAMNEAFETKTGKLPGSQTSESLGVKDSHLEFGPIPGYHSPANEREGIPGPGNAHSIKGAAPDVPNSKKS